MRRKIGKILTLVTLVLFLGVSCSFAQEPKGNETNKKEGWEHSKKNDMFRELNLTKEQEAKLGEFRKANEVQRSTIINALKDDREGLRNELNKGDSNPKEIERLSSEIKRLQGEMLDLHIKSVLNMKQVLTPEQFKQFQEKAKEKQKMHREHPGMKMEGMKKENTTENEVKP